MGFRPILVSFFRFLLNPTTRPLISCSRIVGEWPARNHETMRGKVILRQLLFRRAMQPRFFSTQFSGGETGNFGTFLQNPNFIQSQYVSNFQLNQYVGAGSVPPNPDFARSGVVESSPAVGTDDTLETLDSYCAEGNAEAAVELLGVLEAQRVSVDHERFMRLVRLCGEANALEEAKRLHEHMVRSLSPLPVSVLNKILEMYFKCASVEDAFNVFDQMPSRNLTTWDTMISWLAKLDLGEDAIDIFSEFKMAGFKPDAKMFIGVFSACGSLGDVDEGMLHFESMRKDYGIVPTMEHYVGVVKMLGTAGYIDEALEFIEKMPLEPSIDVWEVLMNLCRVHGNLELGDRCCNLVEQLDPSSLDEKSKAGLLPVVKDKKKKDVTGQNSLKGRNRVFEYRAGDTSHPESDKIYRQLKCLKEQLKEAGYIPETRFVLHDIDQESKEEAIHAHSERLAIAQALMTSPARQEIRIIKNLRCCGDCHVTLKLISKIVGRLLVIRDTKRFHHFKDGVCSCKDYW